MRTFFQRDAGVALLRKYQEDKSIVNVRLLFRESVVSEKGALEGSIRYSGVIVSVTSDGNGEDRDYLVTLQATGEGMTQDQRKVQIQIEVHFYASLVFAVEVTSELKPNLVEVPKIGVGR